MPPLSQLERSGIELNFCWTIQTDPLPPSAPKVHRAVVDQFAWEFSLIGAKVSGLPAPFCPACDMEIARMEGHRPAIGRPGSPDYLVCENPDCVARPTVVMPRGWREYVEGVKRRIELRARKGEFDDPLA